MPDKRVFLMWTLMGFCSLAYPSSIISTADLHFASRCLVISRVCAFYS